jgi:hypothetical protein
MIKQDLLMPYQFCHQLVATASERLPPADEPLNTYVVRINPKLFTIVTNVSYGSFYVVDLIWL